MARVALHSDTPAWRFQTWAAFLIALGSTSVGIWFLDTPAWTRAFLGLGLWFTVSSTFALAKALRDQHESQKITSVVDEAKTERILRDLAA